MARGSLYYLLLIVVIALAGAFGLSAPAAAQTALVGTQIDLCVKPAHPADTANRLFGAERQFDCITPQTKFGRGDYWVLAPHIAAKFRQNGQISVRFPSVWQERVTLYARYAGKIAQIARLDSKAAAAKLQLGAIIEVPLAPDNGPPLELLWHVEGSQNLRGIVVRAWLATLAQSIHSNLLLAAVYGAFAGLCLALLIYNLSLWLAMRHHFQLAYCAMVAALLVYASSSSGAVAWLWPGITDNGRLRISYFSLAMAAASAIIFARTFFESRVFAGLLGRASVWLSAWLVVVGASTAILAPWQFNVLDPLYSTAFLALVGIVPVILWRAAQERSNYLWVFAIAWAAPVLFAGLRVANNMHLIAWSFWLDNSTILSMAAEALLSSLAIVYRVRLLSIERDDARVQEIAARALADLDPLTGLLNRRSLLSQAIGAAGDKTLLLIDIDHFRQVNETIGHDGGDEVLRIVARVLRNCAPPDALVSRIGGEEFAIIASDNCGPVHDRVATRLRAERMPFDLVVTASIGVCHGPMQTEGDWKMLYRRADQALYQAKADGRDRVRHAKPASVPLPVAA